MIITKTPFRISFAGGGTDIEEFYSRHEGAVLSATINKYMYISSHVFFEKDKIRAKYSRTETVGDVNELKHPIIKEVLKQFKINGALEISSVGDVPSGTGLGSSSAFTVGMLHNMYARSGVHVTKERIASEACDIEINRLGEPIGKQDQYASAFGGLNIIRFNASGEVNVEPVHLKKETYKALQGSLLMFFTGDQRSASKILAEQKKIMGSGEKNGILLEMAKLVDKLSSALYSGDLNGFGKMLHEGWLLKRQLTDKITNPEIDSLYSKALDNGASGGKLLGAGGGGFLLFYCEPDNQPKLRAALSNLREMHFKLENEGSKLIYIADEYTPQ